MKRLLFLLLYCLLVFILKAQEKPLFIFDDFYAAKIYFKNRSVTAALMNYDAVNDKMYFKRNDDLMELTNFAMIDSIVWSHMRCFVPYGNGFIEQVQLDNGKVFIHWRIKNVNVGSKGALGTVTQAKVETINIRSMGIFSAEDPKSHCADVYQQKNANEYYIPINAEFKKITTLKHLYKLYPKHKEAIKEYADRERIKMNEPLLVLQLLNYCLGLKD